MSRQNMTPEQVQEMEETIESLRNEVAKHKELRAETTEKCNAEMARLTAEYEDRISLMQKEHQEEVQELQNNINLLEGHIDMLVHDNTIMDAQLDIVKMMCGVPVEQKGRVKIMVNERQGKKYNPRPVYNRKLLRSVIRAGVQKQFGQHNVSLNMAGNFERIRKGQVK